MYPTDETGTQQARLPARGHRVLMVMVLLAGFAAGIGVTTAGVLPWGTAGASSSLEDRPEFATFEQTWDLIHIDYVDSGNIDDSALIYAAISGMTDALGDTGHTRFLDPSDAQLEAQSQRGEYVGIGVQLDDDTGRPVIQYTLENSPAEQAGLQSGDIIVAVDGTETEGISDSQLGALLIGDEGTQVTLTIERTAGGEKTFELSLTRTRIAIQPVTWTMLPGKVAHIQIVQFQDGATKAVKAALTEARAAGAQAIILDLRNNPGGLVTEEIGVASQFLPEGATIYQYQEQQGGPRPVHAIGGGIATDLPVAVLINEGTASAAEILAVAIQENGRGKLYGERTFGTGTVLSPIALDDGSVLVLGTALWLTPKGNQLWHEGVTPDQKVALPSATALTRPSDNAGITAAALAKSDDTQLLAAYEALKGILP